VTRIQRFRVGYAGGPNCGVGHPAPPLSWLIETDEPGWRQTAYEMELDGTSQGRVASEQSVLVPWPTAPLSSREAHEIRVRVWGQSGERSDWSDPILVEAGLLRPGDWGAEWISPAQRDDEDASGPAHHFRREFEIDRPIVGARLYVTSAGINQIWLNGSIVGDALLDPGWTSYAKRIRYATYDVSDALVVGTNALGAMVADGWWRGFLTWDMRRNVYGDRLGLLAQLEVRYEDGTMQTVMTDGSWSTTTGPVLAADLYNGETYDARLDLGAWATAGYDETAGYDDSCWTAAETFAPAVGRLEARSGPPVRRVDYVDVVEVLRSPSGKVLLDFGQNLVGWVRFTVEGPAGTVVTLRHAEVLDEGELGVRPLRNAEATDRYILKGEGPETWEPSFTFHGYRFVEVEGWPGDLTPGDFRSVVISSDLEETGTFECSNDLINRLHSNVYWGMRGNFVDVPTDCPQRDERLGWTGDLQVFASTATDLFDVCGMLSEWLGDLALDQRDDGMVPLVVPDVLFWLPTAGWGDAATLIPWTLYQRYDDLGVLSRQFDSMRAWVDSVDAIAGPSRLWTTGRQLGDWLDPDAPPEDPGGAKVDGDLVASAYFARSARVVADAAGVLGIPEHQEQYGTLADEVREAWRKRYLDDGVKLTSDAVTAYAVAIEFGLLEADEIPAAVAHIARLAKAARYRVSTGFLGTPLVLPALSKGGDYETAYRLLTETSCPSWLYPITMGATTIWERWDSLLPDGSINPGEMTSFNHYALGAVGDWLHQVIGGLAPGAPGYRRLLVAPVPGGDITWAKSSLVTPYGLARCSWTLDDGEFVLDVLVPPNTEAEIHLPGEPDETRIVGSGAHRWQSAIPTGKATGEDR